ncbi:4-alpha-glucanotransferase [Arcanobacterium canis]
MIKARISEVPQLGVNMASREKLISLANAYRVATEYWDFDGNLTQVEDETLAAVLAAMGVDTSSDAAADAALKNKDEAPWRQILPTCTVARDDQDYSVFVHVPDGWAVKLEAYLEDGSTITLPQVEDFTPARNIDGHMIGQARFLVPAGTPTGYHTLHAEVSFADSEIRHDSAPLIVTPARLDNSALDERRSWGMMAQLYSVRSKASWGLGDTRDLAEMASTFGAMGADYLLVNPLHAAEPIEPLENSPYLPTTRRFFNPMYIRPEDILEVAYLSGPDRSLVAWAGEDVKKSSLKNEHIDRNASWSAKRKALEVIFAAGRSQSRQREFERYCKLEGQGLADFALWCAIVEKYEGAFPNELRDIKSPYVARERRELAERVQFWMWLQWVMDSQLEAAQNLATRSGMRFGIAHDLAVGVHSAGSDRWTIPEAFANGVEVGAPADMYNQQGQNWSQPPWRPDALEKMAYSPLRDMARTVLRHAGMIRVDHVAGLFRLWWIPVGASAAKGTYVYFNHEAMVGVLLLEAQRAGATVVGEDLGTVEPWTRDYLKERGIFGTSVFWFEKSADGMPLPPENYRSDVLASVDTHDLPPAAGYLAGEHVDLRERLGLLVEPVEKVRADAELEKEQVLHRLREYGLVGEEPSEREIVEALHVYVARTPAPFVCVSLVDAVGERRAQNQPGTFNEYPNWCIPLADGTEEVVLTEELPTNPRLQSLVSTLNAAMAEEEAKRH